MKKEQIESWREMRKKGFLRFVLANGLLAWGFPMFIAMAFISQPFSVNPARSTGVALYVGDWAIAQLWLFWVAPLVGGAIGAAVYRFIGKPED